MSLNEIRLKDWWWVLYPVMVVVFIVLGVNYVFSSGNTNLVRFTAKPEEAQAKQKVVTELNSKLNELKLVNKTAALGDVKKLLAAVPASKKVWFTVVELQNAASQAGTIIASYKGSVGDVKLASDSATPLSATALAEMTPLGLDVSYEVNSFDQVYTILKYLQQVLPLVKINKISYSTTNLDMSLEGAFTPWQTVALDEAAPLPDYKTQVKTAIDKIANFEDLSSEN